MFGSVIARFCGPLSQRNVRPDEAHALVSANTAQPDGKRESASVRVAPGNGIEG